VGAVVSVFAGAGYYLVRYPIGILSEFEAGVENVPHFLSNISVRQLEMLGSLLESETASCSSARHCCKKADTGKSLSVALASK
jgi:hypothetical protein